LTKIGLSPGLVPKALTKALRSPQSHAAADAAVTNAGSEYGVDFALVKITAPGIQHVEEGEREVPQPGAHIPGEPQPGTQRRSWWSRMFGG